MNKKIERKFKNLLYKSAKNKLFGYDLERIKSELNKLLQEGNAFEIKTKRTYSKKLKCLIEEEYKHYKYNNYNERVEEYTEIINVIETGNSLGYTYDEIYKLHYEYFRNKIEYDSEIEKRSIGETKDNRKSFNFHGGFGHSSKPYGTTTYRYPRKSRSKRTWKNFYTLFPHLAKIDKWDGNNFNNDEIICTNE